MPCFTPNKAYEVVDVDSGEVSIRFQEASSVFFKLVRVLMLPCGQCAGCRVGRAREMASRCMHEAHEHEDNCFVTLTYNDYFLPPNGSLVKKHFQDFMKRLRDRFRDFKIREYHCGEYGELLSRPHYHALIFGFDFPDKYLWKVADSGNLFRSRILESIWPFGFSTIGHLSFESASYVCSYIIKKITGKMAANYYKGRLPEYAEGSRRPGIGHSWIAKYKHDVYPCDQIIVGKNPFKPPRYYDKFIEKEKPRLLENIKRRRILRAEKYAADQTPARLKVRRICLQAKLKKKIRSFEL